MNVLDLFSGIGGFSLGLERAGMRTVAFCEIAPYCQRVLAKHWPDVPVYGDIRELTAAQIVADAHRWRQPKQPQCNGKSLSWQQSSCGDDAIGLDIDLICGGFPCQDISVAGKGAGIGGARSGLWSEYARIIGEVRPRYVIVENVAALLGRGLGRVLGDLAALGFDAEWHCIPASAVGAPHRRDRVWIVAYAHSGGRREQGHVGETPRDEATGQSRDGSEGMGNAEGFGCEWPSPPRSAPSQSQRSGLLGLADGPRLAIGPGTLAEWAHAATTGAGWWATEPDVGRVVAGVPARVDRRKRLVALGNAVVPQISEIIGRVIMMAER